MSLSIDVDANVIISYLDTLYYQDSDSVVIVFHTDKISISDVNTINTKIFNNYSPGSVKSITIEGIQKPLKLLNTVFIDYFCQPINIKIKIKDNILFVSVLTNTYTHQLIDDGPGKYYLSFKEKETVVVSSINYTPKSESTIMCQWCEKYIVETINLPCGHFVFCIDCAKDFINGGFKYCPSLCDDDDTTSSCDEDTTSQCGKVITEIKEI